MGPEKGRKLLARPWPAVLQDGAGPSLALSPAYLPRTFVQTLGWELELGQVQLPTSAEATPLGLDQEW